MKHSPAQALGKPIKIYRIVTPIALKIEAVPMHITISQAIFCIRFILLPFHDYLIITTNHNVKQTLHDVKLILHFFQKFFANPRF
jgi:hypothetical protein